ncbi:MAG: hypothetical protein AB7V50_01290 [Vampirovibrionia bacterium]
MILKAFSDNIRQYPISIPPTILLSRWLRSILSKTPENHVENIIHNELTILNSTKGLYAIVGKNKNGQKLLDNLYKYVQSLENQSLSRWLHETKANEFDTEN